MLFPTPRKAIPSEIPRLIIFKELEISENKDFYSQQLKNIINKMIEISPDKRPTSEEMCAEIRNEYIKIFLKTSSISSVLRCLYS